MTQKHPIFTLSIRAAAALNAERFVTAAGAVPAAGANAFGVTTTSAAAGELVAADVLGSTVVVAGGAISAGAAIEVGTAGKAVARTSGTIVARALQAAAADGDRIEVFLIPN